MKLYRIDRLSFHNPVLHTESILILNRNPHSASHFELMESNAYFMFHYSHEMNNLFIVPYGEGQNPHL